MTTEPEDEILDAQLVHYEVFVRKSPTSRWVLELAIDKPHVALAAAEELVTSGRVAAAMVTKETFNPRSRTFHSDTLFKENVDGAKRKLSFSSDWDPLCAGPPDLYTDRARERIAGLVEGFLARNKVTAFELLHNAELVERLEAATTELQHAVQKFAIAEAQIRGGVTHDMIRRIQRILDQATARLSADFRRGAFPPATPKTFAGMANLLVADPDGPYLLGGSIAAVTSAAPGWPEKLSILLDLVEAAPPEGPSRDLAFGVIDQLLAEMLVSDSALQALVGDADDVGGALLVLTRLVSPQATHQAVERDPRLKEVLPPLPPEAARLAERLSAGELRRARTQAAKRVLADLASHKRLRPADAGQEIMVLRALAHALQATPSSLIPEEDVGAALSTRSRSMLSTDFLEAYLGEGRSARNEAEALLWLAANVVGAANKRRVGRLVQASVSSLRFETEATTVGQSPAAQLAALAVLQRTVVQCGLLREEEVAVCQRLGRFGKMIESKAQLVATLMKSKASSLQKLTFLLRLASGEMAPIGGAADLARAEALKLIKDDGFRAELAAGDETQLAAVRDLLQQSGLAA